MLKTFEMRRGCTVPSPLTWPSTKTCDGTEELAVTGTVDGEGGAQSPAQWSSGG